MAAFEAWSGEVDALCLRHLACTWRDLCGDREPLERSFEDGDTPLQFVRWWAEKYDLFWRDEPGAFLFSGI